jgi:hypothetical protein
MSTWNRYGLKLTNCVMPIRIMFIIDKGVLNRDVSLSLSTNSKTLKYISLRKTANEMHFWMDNVLMF